MFYVFLVHVFFSKNSLSESGNFLLCNRMIKLSTLFLNREKYKAFNQIIPPSLFFHALSSPPQEAWPAPACG